MGTTKAATVERTALTTRNGRQTVYYESYLTPTARRLVRALLEEGHDAMQGQVMRTSRRGRSYGRWHSPTRLMVHESRQDHGTAVFLAVEEARAYAQRRLDVMAKVFASLASA